jgi:hypothetical protein
LVPPPPHPPRERNRRDHNRKLMHFHSCFPHKTYPRPPEALFVNRTGREIWVGRDFALLERQWNPVLF